MFYRKVLFIALLAVVLLGSFMVGREVVGEGCHCQASLDNLQNLALWVPAVAPEIGLWVPAVAPEIGLWVPAVAPEIGLWVPAVAPEIG